MWRSGYLYEMSILWSNYWHWKNLVIRNKWAFFVCKQIAFWFIRDAPLRTNYSRCCLCFQWLKGPTWISYKRVTILFNPALSWTGILLARAAATFAEHSARGLLIYHTTFSWRPHWSPCLLQEGRAQGWPLSWLQQLLVPHVTAELNAPLVQIVGLHHKAPPQAFLSRAVMGIIHFDDKNLCSKYPSTGKEPFSRYVHAHVQTEHTRNWNTLLTPHTKSFLARACLWWKGSGQIRSRVTIFICLKNVWVDETAGS